MNKELLTEVKNTLAMVENELCFGGNWEDAKARIKRCEAQLTKALGEKDKDVCPECLERKVIPLIRYVRAEDTADHLITEPRTQPCPKCCLQKDKDVCPECKGEKWVSFPPPCQRGSRLCPTCLGTGKKDRLNRPDRGELLKGLVIDIEEHLLNLEHGIGSDTIAQEIVYDIIEAKLKALT